MVNYDVPFYSNPPEGTYCFQAAVRSILKYFFPKEEYTLDELATITAKKEGKWTWPYAGLVWMQEKGLEVRNIELMDNARFANEGKAYLVEFYNQEQADVHEERSDLPTEQANAKRFVEKVRTEARQPDINEIKELLSAGWLLICNVNSRALNNKEGFVGHFVVVKGFDPTNLIIHDPGLPPQENRSVSFEQFEKAWMGINGTARNIMAFKLK